MENISCSTSLKSFAPKRGINRTSIKVTQNCDVERLIHNPFYEPENLDDQLMVKVRKPIIKSEPVDLNDIVEQNIVELEVKPDFDNNSQSKIDSLGLIKIENNAQSSLPKITSQKHSAINNISLKNNKCYDIKHLKRNPVYESDDLVFDQTETLIIKREPETVDDIIEQEINMEINPYSTEDSLSQIDSHNMVKNENDSQSLLLKSYISKSPVLNKSCLKITENDGIKNLENLGIDQTPVKIKTPIIKCETEEINDIIEQEINMEMNPYSTEDLQNQLDPHSLVKRKDNIQSSLFKSSTPKHSVINRTSSKPSNNCDIKNLMSNNLYETENLSFDQVCMNMKKSFVRYEPENIDDIIEQTIEMEMKECFSHETYKNRIENCSDVNIKKNNLTSLSKDFTSKNQGINHVSLKTIENSNVKQIIHPSFCEQEGLVNDQVTTKVKKIPVIKCEPKDYNDTVNQNSVGMEIHLEEENLFNEETSKYTGLEDFCCNNLNCTKTESQKIVIKKESIDSNITYVKNDVETIRNDNTLETEKKKISWEEYKAKVGKIGLSKISGKM